MEPPLGSALPKVIGTVEAGYQSCETPISYEKAVTLAKLIAQRALDIRRARLRYVLEIIAENARKILQADFITLHFLWDSHQSSYIYQARAGSISDFVSDTFPPRMNEQGVGWQAIRAKRPRFIQSSDESFNPVSYGEGSRAYAAFPLLIDRTKQKIIHQATSATIVSEDDASQEQIESAVGVLYVHYQHEHEFTEDEIHRGEFFAERAVDAIWHAMTYQQVHDKVRQMAALHSITQSLSHVPEKGNLLSHIAWNTLNVLAADVITIYAYIQTEKQFITPPSIAGKLKSQEEMGLEINERDVPFLLIDYGQNIYATNQSESTIFRDSTFAKREGIVSVAGILLKVDEDIVGVMFINYRRPHSFSKEEKRIIDTLVASAAIAIKNQRWLQILSDIDHEIITTLEPEKLLDLIVRRAVQITGADFGLIRRPEPISQDLIAQAKHPGNEPTDQAWERIKMGEGVAGWVAEHRKSELVKNVVDDQRYVPYFTNTISELCVPLLEKDGDDGGLIGVLAVESRKKTFTQRDLQRLEVLADLAVIAIQNSESKKKLVKMETMATVGELTSQLLHRMNNDVGASRVLLREAISSLNNRDFENAKGRASQTLRLTDQISQNLGNLKTWQQEQPQLINLSQTISRVLEQIQVSHGCTLTVNLPSNLPKVLSGKQQLIGIFDILVQNAIDAIDAISHEGTLSIVGRSIERETDLWIEVCFIDTGCGISEDSLEKIFTLGFTTKSRNGNMGFGLWWARNQVESLGGQLTVKSVLNRGSEFIVVLPGNRTKEVV
jgi:signal transduction histidine kinase